MQAYNSLAESFVVMETTQQRKSSSLSCGWLGDGRTWARAAHGQRREGMPVAILPVSLQNVCWAIWGDAFALNFLWNRTKDTALVLLTLAEQRGRQPILTVHSHSFLFLSRTNNEWTKLQKRIALMNIYTRTYPYRKEQTEGAYRRYGKAARHTGTGTGTADTKDSWNRILAKPLCSKGNTENLQIIQNPHSGLFSWW